MMSKYDSWASGPQFEPAKITPKLLDAWEALARAESHYARLGDWNWPGIVRSLIVAIRAQPVSDPAPSPDSS